MTEGPPPDALLLRQLITGKMITMLIESIATLDVATQLKDGPLTSDELAKRVGAHPDRLYRAMRALTVVNIFQEAENKTFSLTPMGQLLRSDNPQSLRGMARWLGSPTHSLAWCELTHSIRTGDIAFDKAFGKPVFAHFEEDAAIRGIFQDAMSGMTAVAPKAITAVDWTQFSRICDVGGGRGNLLHAILGAAPAAKGVLFELPQVSKAASEFLDSKSELAGRVEVVAGDFFATCPSGCDAYTMKYIMHDHDDEKCVTILKHCAAALAATEGGKAHGRVFVMDQIVPGPGVPHFAKLLDIEMFAMLTGRERTEAEFAKLFESAGLQLVKVHPTPDWNILEAKLH